jgi:hypothetical protein
MLLSIHLVVLDREVNFLLSRRIVTMAHLSKCLDLYRFVDLSKALRTSSAFELNGPKHFVVWCGTLRVMALSHVMARA